MSLSARQELLSSLKPEYRMASVDERKGLLDNFVTATGYNRKHAIAFLARIDGIGRKKGKRKVIYDDPVKEALVKLWNAANRICSKRLVPFLPALTEAMERFGHLQLTEVEREKLLAENIRTLPEALRMTSPLWVIRDFRVGIRYSVCLICYGSSAAFSSPEKDSRKKLEAGNRGWSEWFRFRLKYRLGN